MERIGVGKDERRARDGMEKGGDAGLKAVTLLEAVESLNTGDRGDVGVSDWTWSRAPASGLFVKI